MKDVLATVIGRPVSRETFDRLLTYADLIKEENARQNLIARSTLEQLWERHILDSAQLVRFEPFKGCRWADVGSGAGLPGIVIACLVEGPITLIEPRRLRADFLTHVVRSLGLNATVEMRSSRQVSGPFDVIAGRAVASMSAFLRMCAHFSTENTVWILPKGKAAQSELEEARARWQGVFHVEQSLTAADSYIVVARGVKAVWQ